MILIACYGSSGNGRCDARCYDADGGKCECVCGGINHGVGLDAAIENTRNLAQAINEYFGSLEEAKKNGGVFVDPAVNQLSIFGWLGG